MTPREKLGLELARAVVRFVDDTPVEEAAQRTAVVFAQELDDDTMEALRVSFAARNARTAGTARRGRRKGL